MSFDVVPEIRAQEILASSARRTCLGSGSGFSPSKKNPFLTIDRHSSLRSPGIWDLKVAIQAIARKLVSLPRRGQKLDPHLGEGLLNLSLLAEPSVWVLNIYDVRMRSQETGLYGLSHRQRSLA